jgi:thiamine biosynthesis protein ThiC
MATARQFDHALIARQQAALVATIARDVQEGHARPDHLDAYRASIRQERQFLNRAQQRQQRPKWPAPMR